MSPVKHTRAAHLRWVKIGDVRVSPKTQRKFDKAKAESIAAEFNLEGMGFPTLNYRDGFYWCVDGQHRIWALKFHGFSDDDQIQCEVYEDLQEREEAEVFLERNNAKAVSPFDKFRVGLVAERETECNIQRTVEAQGCKISRQKDDYCIGSIAALRAVHRLGEKTLARSVYILKEAYDGDPSAFEAPLLRGMGLVCQRYNGQLNDEAAAAVLAATPTVALQRKANALREKTGHSKSDCVAAVIVETVNKGLGRKKLESWWR